MASDPVLTPAPAPVADPLRAIIDRLAGMRRASCSAGEHEAADWIAQTLRDLGAQAEVERTSIHGTYWWPLGLTSAGGLAAVALGRRGRGWLGAALGLLSCGLVFDELSARRRWLRRLLPKQVTANVVGSLGDQRAERTLVVVSHHDAAHSGIFFNPRITEFLARHRTSTPQPRDLPGPMLPIAIGPALGALAALTGSRGLASLTRLLCGGIIASFAHIATSDVVPGANDNLTGVATLVELARSVAERPIPGLRIMFVSTGSEESLMEGVRAFGERHFASLPGDTQVLCVDAVGSPHLVLVEAEGILEVRRYDETLKDLITQCAAERRIPLIRGYTMRLGTDGYIALRAGIPAACLMSLDDNGVCSNYHWPTDTPDRVDYCTLRRAAELCDAFARRLGRESRPAWS
jgi:hypothetical protein